jgi:signal transduction histidine kinase
MEDITARIENEKEIKAKNDELAKVNNQMEKLLYSASHDLRSPITSILGMISILRLEVTNKSILDNITKIEYSAHKLDKVIHSIVNFSKNNYRQIDTVKIEFKKLLDQVIERFAQEENFTKISFEIGIEEEIPFYSDQERLEIMLENIIRNSITFCNEKKPRPFIKIWIKTSESNAFFEISDNGIGIDKSHLENIFNMFYKASELSKGAGLGLFIVKESLRKLNGTIRVESDIGLGTNFFIRIPKDRDLHFPN